MALSKELSQLASLVTVGATGPSITGNLKIAGVYGNINLTTYASLFVDGTSTNNILQVSSSTRAKGGGLWSTGGNTRLYSVDAIEFRVGSTLRDQDTPTGGTTVAIIDAFGNLGLGSISPQNDTNYGGVTLNGASGSIITLRTANTNVGRIYAAGTDFLNIDANGTAAGTIIFRNGTSSTERMRLDSSGNLGIGTTAPTAKLHIVGANVTFDTNAIGQVLISSTTAYNSTPRAGIAFSVKYNSGGASTAGGCTIQSYKENATDGDFGTGLLFTTQANGAAPAERMRLDASGNLGIGTTTPSAKLEVNGVTKLLSGGTGGLHGSDNSSYFLFQASTTANTAAIYLNGQARSGFASHIQYAGAQHVWFNETVGVERMRIDGSGNLTLGAAAAGTNRVFNINGVANKAGRIVFQESGTDAWLIGNGAASENGNFEIYSATGNNFVFTRTGNLGIGTSSPAGKLHVNGTARLGSLDINLTTANSAVWIDGSDFGVGTFYGNALKFLTSNTEKMRITNNGSLVVGLSTAYSKFTFSMGVDGVSNGSSAATRINEFANAAIVLHNQDSTGNGNKSGLFFAAAGSPGLASGIAGYREAGSWNTGLQFYTNNITGGSYTDVIQERMRITAAGRVGINTTAPVSTLQINDVSGALLNYVDTTSKTYDAAIGIHVGSSNTANNNIAGGLTLTNNVYSAGAYSPIISFSSRSPSNTYNNSYAGIYGIAAAQGADANWVKGHLVFATSISAGLTERMRLDFSGNLGIGTPSPVSLLETYVSSAGKIGITVTNSNASAGPAYIAFKGYDWVRSAIWHDRANGAPLQFAINPNTTDLTVNGCVVAASFDSNGNLGIGTTTPAAKLSVVGSAANVNYISSITSGGTGGGNATAAYGQYINVGGANSNTSFYALYAEINYTVGGSNYAGYFKNAGSASVPTYGLYAQTTQTDCNGPGIAYGGYFNVATGGLGTLGTTYGLYVNNAGTTGATAYGLYVNSATGAVTTIPFSVAVGGSEKMRLDASGNLLVGTTSVNPAAGVAVNSPSTAPNIRMSHATGTASGAAYMEFNYNQSGCGSITQNGTSAVLYNTSSDYRLKNITGPITTSGAYIDSLKPVEGTWKADGSTFVGLIAHETQEVSRTTVATGTKDGEQMQGMDYSSAEIIANLIAELQSLRARVAQLESK